MENSRLTGYPSIDKPWLKYYSEEQIHSEIPQMSAYEYLKFCNKDNMDNVAIRYNRQIITYSELISRIDDTASALAGFGIKKRETVVAVLPASLEEVVLLYAADKIGACISFLAPGTPTDVIAAALEEFNVSALFVFAPFFAENQLLSLADRSADQKIVYIGPMANMNGEQNHNIISWDRFQEYNGTVETEESFDIQHAMFIAKTGGTTGKPKSVLLSDQGFNAIVHQYLNSPMNFHKGDRWLRLWPIFSATAAVSSNHLPLCAGMELILASAAQLEQIDVIILNNSPNHIPLTPMILDILMNSPLLKGKDLSFLKTLGCGGMPMTVEFEHRAAEFFKAHNIQTFLGCGYGMTENSSVATVRMNKETAPVGGVGVPLPKTVITAFEPYTETEKKYNELGEICIQSPAFMIGYFKDDVLTNSILKKHSDGTIWLHSGDLGYVDKDGQIYICDRLVRAFPVVSGEKIYPAALEEILDAASGVRKSSVVGIPNKEIPNCFIPVCFIVPDGTLKIDEIRCKIAETCKSNIPDYAVPKQFFFIDEFPLTSIGKVDYRALEQKAAETI